ncbi:MAG TPA: YhjD/YihY/BrkB family envelope integrity protein [Candidatus Saccharimonadales bacterium]|nr:YhjD/YihY/BrkB family envelope integrity protein [Candidatus Saccharimonadales bacterium]
MNSLVSKIRTAIYQAIVVANARYRDDVLNLQAMGLTYSTLLSLVPFLAVMFSVLKAFGVQNGLEPFLAQLLQPLGNAAAEVTSSIIEFVENIRVGILGGAGVAMLFYTVVTLVAKIEDALNQIWRLPHSRTWSQRVTAYLSVILVGPVMVFTALTLTASAQSYWLVERLYKIGFVSYFFTLTTSVMPFALLCATFTFLYKFIPYTKVRLSSALVGGATAGILWQLVGTAFAAFVANSGRYDAVYSSFAIVIVFLIWLYTGWLIFLIGAEISYFHQHPSAFIYEALTGGRGYRFQEWLALSALVEIARRHSSDEPPWEQTELAARFGVSNLGHLIDEFVRRGILLRSAEPEGVALARPAENIYVKEILDIVGGSTMPEVKNAGAIGDILLRRDQAAQKTLEGITLKSLVQENSATVIQFPPPGPAISSRKAIPPQPPNGD